MEDLVSRCTPVRIPDHAKVYAGASVQWDGTSVARLVPSEGSETIGYVTDLTETEFETLCGFERGYTPEEITVHHRDTGREIQALFFLMRDDYATVFNYPS